jgi:hypothetical protein
VPVSLLLLAHYAQILFNKAVLDQLKFPFPMFLVFWHMLVATILTQIMSRTTNMLPGVKEVRPTPATLINALPVLSVLSLTALPSSLPTLSG